MDPRLALALALGVTLGACLRAEQVREVTYPPSFSYVTKAQIRDSMSGLAYQIHALDVIMAREGGVRPEDRARVVEILTEMRRLAYALEPGARSNHPRIERYAPRLQADVDRALLAARSNPPDYYFAGHVSGACEYCHARPRELERRPPARSEPPG